MDDNKPVSRKRKNARNVVYVHDVTVGVHRGVHFVHKHMEDMDIAYYKVGKDRPCYGISI